MNILSRSPEETLRLGEKVGERLIDGMIIALEGDLGGGKTTFTKGLAKGLGIKEDITSPSFTLERIYKIPSKQTTNDKRQTTLYHFDFYRIDNPKDMVSYELTEALEDQKGIVVIEWAEKIEAELPKEKLIVKFKYIDENTRKIVLKSFGERYKELQN